MKHLGIDVHLRSSEVCELSERGKVLDRSRIPTTESGLRSYFGRRNRCRIVMECGASTPWIYRLLRELDHDVVVVDARNIRLIAESTLKCDRVDAEILARLSRFDPALLQPVYQRSYAAQELRTRLKVRQSLVRSRAKLITTIRGSLRAHGYRLGSCATRSFVARWATLEVEESLRQTLEPLVETIAELTDRITVLQRELYAEAKSDELPVRLQEVPGVGPLVALSFVAWVDRPERFATSRAVGASLGLRPILRASGDRAHRGRITRQGDVEMRWLLVQAAHASFLARRDSALRRWAEQLERRVGKAKAAVALARKLAIVMHRMWVTGEGYQPFPKAA